MTDFCTTELDDIHRLVPPEIFADIGIVVDATAKASAAGDVGVDAEELAAHLAGVLGLATRRYHVRQQPPTMTTRRATTPQGCGRMNGVVGDGGGGMIACYTPAPGFGKNGAPFGLETVQSAQRFPLPAARCAAGPNPSLPPPRRHGASVGTGVFLPRAEAYQTRGSRSSRLLTRKEAAEANATTAMKQRQQACGAPWRAMKAGFYRFH